MNCQIINVIHIGSTIFKESEDFIIELVQNGVSFTFNVVSVVLPRMYNISLELALIASIYTLLL